MDESNKLRRNEAAMLQRLIASGAKIDSQDVAGQTAFAWAASNDAVDCGTSTLKTPSNYQVAMLTIMCQHRAASRSVEALLLAGADTLLHHLGKDLLTFPIMELDDLLVHDGSGDADGPYVAVLGLVYDMSMSANFYGPGGNYEMFAGRDATLNLARNSLEGDLPVADKASVEGAFQHLPPRCTSSNPRRFSRGRTFRVPGLSVAERCALEGWIAR